MEPPSPSRSFLLFRSSLHINQNALSINRLTLTEHPLIHLSAVLPKLLLNQPSAFLLPEEILQDVHSLPEPYQQDISAVDERRKEEAIFPSSATMISAGFSSNVRRRVFQIPLHDKPLPLGLCLNTDNAVILLVRARFARPK